MVRRVWSKSELKRVTRDIHSAPRLVLGAEYADESFAKYKVTDRALLGLLQQLYTEPIGNVYYKNGIMILPVLDMSLLAQSNVYDNGSNRTVEAWIFVNKMSTRFLEYMSTGLHSSTTRFKKTFERDKRAIKEAMERAKNEYIRYKAMLESGEQDILYLNDKIVFEEGESEVFYVLGKIDGIPTFSMWSLRNKMEGPTLERTNNRVLIINGAKHVTNPHAVYQCLGTFDIKSAWKRDPEEAIIKMIQFTSSLNHSDPPVVRQWELLLREYGEN